MPTARARVGAVARTALHHPRRPGLAVSESVRFARTAASLSPERSASNRLRQSRTVGGRLAQPNGAGEDGGGGGGEGRAGRRPTKAVDYRAAVRRGKRGASRRN